jgi:hypothetical protein
MQHPFDRAYYRVVYPLRQRPTLIVGSTAHSVVDLCEQGIRYLFADSSVPRVGDELRGRLVLPSGVELEIAGKVIRVTPPDAAANLTKGIPFGVMMEEQLYLQQRLASWQ